ncbi:MAG TPA: S4 domain-containing protein, partial [Spirochaetia bacterium]|nr:S4 domain-containing protein [Spirochaetia bacterium]
MENEKQPLKRLQVYLASCGVGSRRACEELIAEGRVTVNGKTVTTQGEKVDPETDVVTFDGKRIKETSQKVYIALH